MRNNGTVEIGLVTATQGCSPGAEEGRHALIEPTGIKWTNYVKEKMIEKDIVKTVNKLMQIKRALTEKNMITCY